MGMLLQLLLHLGRRLVQLDGVRLPLGAAEPEIAEHRWIVPPRVARVAERFLLLGLKRVDCPKRVARAVVQQGLALVREDLVQLGAFLRVGQGVLDEDAGLGLL